MTNRGEQIISMSTPIKTAVPQGEAAQYDLAKKMIEEKRNKPPVIIKTTAPDGSQQTQTFRQMPNPANPYDMGTYEMVEETRIGPSAEGVTPDGKRFLLPGGIAQVAPRPTGQNSHIDASNTTSTTAMVGDQNRMPNGGIPNAVQADGSKLSDGKTITNGAIIQVGNGTMPSANHAPPVNK
jgi:hypothetical protein